MRNKRETLIPNKPPDLDTYCHVCGSMRVFPVTEIDKTESWFCQDCHAEWNDHEM